LTQLGAVSKKRNRLTEGQYEKWATGIYTGFPCCYSKGKDGIDKEQLLVDAHVAGALVF
jgi:hypothetical protein